MKTTTESDVEFCYEFSGPLTGSLKLALTSTLNIWEVTGIQKHSKNQSCFFLVSPRVTSRSGRQGHGRQPSPVALLLPVLKMHGMNDGRLGGLILTHGSRVASPFHCGRVSLIVAFKEQRKAMPELLVFPTFQVLSLWDGATHFC